MKRNHICFCIVILLLFIFPKISTESINLPAASSISLGFIGLVGWAIISPRYLLFYLNNLKERGVFSVINLPFLFSCYIIVTSLLSENFISLIYAIQYSLYLILSIALFSGYFNEVFRLNQSHYLFNIISWISLIFSIGAIVSIFTGPIYPHQVITPLRTLENNIYFPRAIGFTENANFTGGILIVFFAFNWFLYSRKRFQKFWNILEFTALLMTISRSAILSIIAAFLFYTFLRLFFAKIFDKRVFMLLIIIPFVILFVLTIMLLFFDESITSNLIGSFGFGGDYRIDSDTDERLGLWNNGLQNWLNGNGFQIIFGQGFRNSFSTTGIAWETPHNLYIAMLGDFGIAGILLFVSPLIFVLLQTSIDICRIKKPGIESFTMVSLLGLLIHNGTEVFFYSPVIMSLAVIVITLYTQKSEVQNKPFSLLSHSFNIKI